MLSMAANDYARPVLISGGVGGDRAGVGIAGFAGTVAVAVLDGGRYSLALESECGWYL